MSTARKLTLIVTGTAIICVALLAAYFMLEYYEQQNEQLLEQQQIEQQYISDSLRYVNEVREHFIAAGDVKSRRISLYNDMKSYKTAFTNSGFESIEVSSRIDEILIEMLDYFDDYYNGLIDEIETKATESIENRDSFILGIRAEIDDLHARFAAITENGEPVEISNPDAFPGKTARISLYQELGEKQAAFGTNHTISSTASELYDLIDELSGFMTVVETDAVLTGNAQMSAINDRVSRQKELLNHEALKDETGEIEQKFITTLETQKNWFFDFYNAVITAISETQRADIDDEDTINRQISDLQALKEMILKDGIFSTEEAEEVLYSDEFWLLENEIDELITSYNEELDVIAERKALEEANAGQRGEDGLLPNIEEFASEVLRLTNEERAKHGLGSLTADNPLLTTSALIRANEIIILWSHDRPDGRSCFTAYTEIGGQYNKLGENLGSGHRTPEDVVQGWMDSPGHRENMLDPSFTQLGVGVVKDSTGRYYWAQMFCG